MINYLTSHEAAAKSKEEIINTYSVRCLTICADVSDVNQVDQMVSEIEEN